MYILTKNTPLWKWQEKYEPCSNKANKHEALKFKTYELWQ